MTFISTVFQNVYMVKLVRIPGSGLDSRPGRVRGRDRDKLQHKDFIGKRGFNKLISLFIETIEKRE